MQDQTSLTLSTRRVYALPLMGLIPIVRVGVVTGVYLISGADLSAWLLPVAAMVGFGVFAMLILGIGVGASELIERAAIQRVLNDPWARWPQYATDEAWHRAAADQRDEAVKETGFVWAPLLVVGVLLGISLTVVYLATRGNSGSEFGMVMICIALLYLIFGAAIMLRAALIRQMAERRYRDQIQHAPPDAVIGQGGIYHADHGFVSFRRLRDVRYKARTSSRGARVEFDLFRPATRYVVSLEDTYKVEVPSGQEEEAQRLVERIRASRRLK